MRWFPIALLVLAGCGGQMYWTKPGATEATFQADHQPCFKEASISYNIGSEKLYKACMSSRGWTRIQGYVNAPPSQPAFRGPEGDDEFGK